MYTWLVRLIKRFNKVENMQVILVGNPHYLILDFESKPTAALVSDLVTLNNKPGYVVTVRHPTEITISKPRLTTPRQVADLVKPVLIKHGLTVEEHGL